MNKQSLVELLAKDVELKRICKAIFRGNDLWEDLFQHCLLKVLETSDDKIKNIIKNKKQKAYIIKLMLNEHSNKYSDFNKTYATNKTFSQVEFPDENTTTTPVDACKFDIDQTFKYFTAITPETIQATKTLERLIKEDNGKGSGYPYRVELFKLYKEMGSCRKVQDDVGINYVSVSLTIKEVKEEIKKKK